MILRQNLPRPNPAATIPNTKKMMGRYTLSHRKPTAPAALGGGRQVPLISSLPCLSPLRLRLFLPTDISGRRVSLAGKTSNSIKQPQSITAVRRPSLIPAQKPAPRLLRQLGAAALCRESLRGIETLADRIPLDHAHRAMPARASRPICTPLKPCLRLTCNNMACARKRLTKVARFLSHPATALLYLARGHSFAITQVEGPQRRRFELGQHDRSEGSIRQYARLHGNAYPHRPSVWVHFLSLRPDCDPDPDTPRLYGRMILAALA